MTLCRGIAWMVGPCAIGFAFAACDPEVGEEIVRTDAGDSMSVETGAPDSATDVAVLDAPMEATAADDGVLGRCRPYPGAVAMIDPDAAFPCAPNHVCAFGWPDAATCAELTDLGDASIRCGSIWCRPSPSGYTSVECRWPDAPPYDGATPPMPSATDKTECFEAYKFTGP